MSKERKESDAFVTVKGENVTVSMMQMMSKNHF